MSVRVMTAVWDITLPDSEKIVLLALADAANDEGHCWPSIATIAKKASRSERTTQRVIQSLITGGHLTRKERAGHGCEYWVHPRHGDTPVTVTPPSRCRGTPVTVSGDPRHGDTQTVKNRKEPKGGRARERASPPGSENGMAGHARQAEASAGSPLPDDWAPPPVTALIGKAAALVRQWPPGAYEASAETFRLHWLSESGPKGRKRDWGAAFGKWLIGDHAKIMRDARAGVSFAQLAPVLRGAAPQAPVEPVAAKACEDDRSLAIRRELRRELGAVIFDQWFAPVALVCAGSGLVVIAPSEFQRAWIEDRFSPKIAGVAAAVLGEGSAEVRFQVQGIEERAA